MRGIGGSRLNEIPLVALGRQHASMVHDLRAAFDRVVGSSEFILGEEVERFEEEFAAYCGARHCVGVASGTAALGILMRASGIGPGDEVVVPGHTFIASALGVLHAGATPVFCDVDDATGLIDADAAAAVVGPRTAAILAVHLYGQACDMDAVGRLARRHGLAVFEDAAQAHGATLNGRRAGSLAAGAAFSFYPSKNLGALGDGGAICTDDVEIAERARRLRHLGQARKGKHVEIGSTERLDGLQAAFLRVKLGHLDGWNARRRDLAGRYRAGLEGSVRLLETRPGSPCIYHLFPIRARGRDELAARLGDAGIATGVHYSPPVHRQPALVDSGLGGPELPVAEAWAREELSLPMFAELTEDEVHRVVEACHAVLYDAPALTGVELVEGVSV